METEEKRAGGFGRAALAIFILLIAGWLLLTVVGHIISFLFGGLIVILAIVAVIWALRILL